jgi:hypothetical protein
MSLIRTFRTEAQRNGNRKRRFDERNRYYGERGGGCGGCAGVLLLPDAAAETADGGIWIAENVSGLRVDHAAIEGSLYGVWKDVYCSGEEIGSGVSWGCWRFAGKPSLFMFANPFLGKSTTFILSGAHAGGSAGAE